MGKMMMKLPSIFKPKDSRKPWADWAPASCKHPKTLSFRAAAAGDIFKTVNSIFFDPSDSSFTNSSDSASATYSSDSDPHEIDAESLEILVRGAKSERLFFEPDHTSSILEKSKLISQPEHQESLVVSMESENPYDDFRKSMEEMVASHGVRDWEGLEELLGWYLKVNWRKNHGFIVAAFVDLLVDIFVASSSSSADSTYYSCTEESSSSSAATSLLSPEQLLRREIVEEDERLG